nr:MAG TPA_asm: hypothetical protein [Caudoviricetes sp.]
MNTNLQSKRRLFTFKGLFPAIPLDNPHFPCYNICVINIICRIIL